MKLALCLGRRRLWACGTIGLCNGTFYGDMINMSVIIMTLSLGIEVSVGTSDNCKDCALCGESVSLFVEVLGFKVEVEVEVVDWFQF
jgi:hypothetical protein